MNKKFLSENDSLKMVTLITSIGDFISKFAFIKILYDNGYSIFIISTVVIIQSAAIPFGGLFSTLLNGKFKTKNILIGSQILSSFFSFVILYSYLINSISTFVLGIAIFFLSLLNEIFKSSREIHSKSVSGNDHINNQSKLLSGFYQAQFLGPLISISLIFFLPLWIPLVIDLFSFIFSSFLLWKINLSNVIMTGANPIKPFKYIWKNKEVSKIFLLRSVGYWLGAGIFNYLIFSVVTKNYNLDPLMSAWIYSSVGLGAYFLSNLIDKKKTFISKFEDKYLSLIGHIGIALTVIGFIYSKSFILSIIVFVIYGFFMGMNAVGSQAIRRRLVTSHDFSEIIGAESALGKLTEISIATFVFSYLIKNGQGIELWLFISATITIIVGFIYLTFDSQTENKFS